MLDIPYDLIFPPWIQIFPEKKSKLINAKCKRVPCKKDTMSMLYSFSPGESVMSGQFNKTFTSITCKCSYCFQTSTQWLHL